MTRVERSIEVRVPVRTAYNQWTQFESFPQFMEGVKEVRQLDDRRLHWRAEVAGKEREWNAEITEQHPDERVAWTSTDGAPNAGVVTFHYVDPTTTRIMLQLDFTPEGAVEAVGSALGLLERRVASDLERFKAFIEGRGHETGAWRGEIEQEQIGRMGAGSGRTAGRAGDARTATPPAATSGRPVGTPPSMVQRGDELPERP